MLKRRSPKGQLAYPAAQQLLCAISIAMGMENSR